MSSSTRISRQVISIREICPPCELNRIIFRPPARFTLLAISSQTRRRVCTDMVSVPGKARCSSDLPTLIAGRMRTSAFASSNGTIRSMMSALIAASTYHGKMGPMLLDGRNRQDDDGLAQIAGCEFGGRVIGPVKGVGHAPLRKTRLPASGSARCLPVGLGDHDLRNRPGSADPVRRRTPVPAG